MLLKRPSARYSPGFRNRRVVTNVGMDPTCVGQLSGTACILVVFAAAVAFFGAAGGFTLTSVVALAIEYVTLSAVERIGCDNYCAIA